jgi:DHA1 family bicyclomycin/chloramphenicol resistance-like MFS transporter
MSAPSSAHSAFHAHWKAPRWLLAVLIAGLSTLGPFSIDTYLPAFAGIAQDLQASPLQMQQTLSAYLFGFAFMLLFHGALADSFGRRPVILGGLSVFTLASIGCALAPDIHTLVLLRALQGMSAGAGIAVGRAIIRDLFAPTEAQRMMSQVTLFFGIAPAVAPIIGGYLYVHLNWHSIFWFLVAVGALLFAIAWFALPETLPHGKRQPFRVGPLLHGYREVGLDRRFLLLALASGIPFNAMFIYILSAPTFAGLHLRLEPTQFAWLFVTTISGIMAGAWLSGRLAGRVTPGRQINIGFVVMAGACALNLLYNALFAAAAPWALVPLWFIAFGWSLLMPSVTLLVLDEFPSRRGMASSLQGFVGSAFNGLVAGAVAPLAMASTLGLAVGSAAMMAGGVVAWTILHRRPRLQHEPLA